VKALKTAELNLVQLFRAIQRSERFERMSNVELADLLIERVWADLSINSDDSWLVGEIISRLKRTPQPVPLGQIIPCACGQEGCCSVVGVPEGKPNQLNIYQGNVSSLQHQVVGVTLPSNVQLCIIPEKGDDVSIA
jgi:hypothetical protein